MIYFLNMMLLELSIMLTVLLIWSVDMFYNKCDPYYWRTVALVNFMISVIGLIFLLLHSSYVGLLIFFRTLP